MRYHHNDSSSDDDVDYGEGDDDFSDDGEGDEMEETVSSAITEDGEYEGEEDDSQESSFTDYN